MNSTPQPDLHPDAESLNAFVEQFLAEPERLRILGHIASCSRCRQVIYLAQAAASGEESPAPVAAPTFRPAILWTSWRFAWVPVAALAAIVTLAIFLHRPHPVPNTEFARVVPRAEEAGPKPSSQKPAGTGTAQSQVAANLSARKATFAPVRTPSRALTPEGSTSVALPAEAGATEPPAAESQAAAMPPGAFEERLSAQEAAAQFNPQTADAARQPPIAGGSLAGNTTIARITQARMKSMAGQAQASRTLPASAPRLEMKAAPPGNFDRTAQPPIAGSLEARNPNTANLPSGLVSVSTATAQHRTLAIDQAGTLFLSEDSGQHWESIARQWTGRAVEVRVKPAWNGFYAASASGEAAEHGTIQTAAGKPAPASPPAAVFEMVNDRGLIWASADGKTWKAN
jgi:hypothetical protein